MRGDLVPPALIADGLRCRRGGSYALDGCSFALPAGAVTALIGRNGAGKTTLLRAAAGLIRPDDGSVTLFGEPVGAATLPRVGYVAQHPELYGMLTVTQTLHLGARLNPGWDAAYAQRLADAAALPPTAKAGSLAPGQRTRLALVMALAKRPDLLLLDEPLAALDPVARTEVVATLMTEVAEHGTTLLVSSHVVADVEGVCDHVVVLDAGRVRLAAEVDDALAAHHVVISATGDLAALDGAEIVERRAAGTGVTALVRTAEPVRADTLSWHRPTVEELLLGYLRTPVPQPTGKVTAG